MARSLGMFIGTILNGRPRIAEAMHHCVRRRRPAETVPSLPVSSNQLGAYLSVMGHRTNRSTVFSVLYENRLTLMLNSFHRPDLMQRSIKHYSKCTSIVHQIRVVWCEDEDPPPDRIVVKGVSVLYDVMNGTSLNNRFAPLASNAHLCC